MSEMNPGTPARPLRHGETWTWTDCELLLQGVFNGLSVQQIAAELERTQGAIWAQLARLVPEDPDIPNTARGRMDWLRSRLTEKPDYDWRTVLNARANPPYRLWSGIEEEALRHGWDQRTALPDLVLTLRVSERTIVHHLVELGLAADVGEIVDRLGATPGGSVEARARLMRAELAEAIFVLVVPRAGRPSVSLHHSRGGGEEACREASRKANNAESRPWVMQRTLDGRDAGQNWAPKASSD